MSILDLILSIFLFLGLFNGFRKGLTSQLAGLISVLILLMFGGAIAKILKNFLLENQVVSEAWIGIVSYGLTGVLVFLSLSIVAKLLNGIIKSIGLGILEKIGGAGLGFIKVFFIMTLFFYFFFPVNSKLGIIPQNSLNESFILNFVKINIDKIHQFWTYQL
ncbi:Colicin V production protein [Candidatus Ornithobacterium hominis]|uniref:CvpA family protein n=1 Tax=Candidatus Ornithobacterium hominis TaxID=2497989 RepID=UPI0024BBF05F|nr:CvpA family protein [Candidatus Ornithobacterium hominis]CAI9430379.1 Colicin V production protein [Candidatus Ornithobacterium hominis]